MARNAKTKHCVSDTRQQHVRRLQLSALLCFTLRFAQKHQSMCNLCIVIITENSTQLHPSNMKLMTISLHEIFMFFLLTIFFYFLFAFLRFRVSRNSQLFSYFTLCLLPCLLHRFDGRKNGQNNFQGSVGRFDVIVNYVQGAASNFFSISDARS